MITFDTGVLIALERRDKTTWDRFRRLRERAVPLFVPASCESEWWRKSPVQAEVRLAVLPLIVALTDPIACAAGEALGSLKRVKVTSAITIDAQVMATAAARGGGAVLTSDPDDLSRFARHFPSVTVVKL